MQPGTEGRWSLLRESHRDTASPTEQQMAQATQLIERYGVLTREMVASEGLDGGLSELRSLMRGGISGSMLAHSPAQHLAQQQQNRAVPDHFIPDKSREYPVEGADAYGALPEDLVPSPEPPPAPVAPATVQNAAEASDMAKDQA